MISRVKPSAITIPSMHGRTRAVLVIGFCTAVAVAVAFAPPTPQWARHASSLAGYLAVVASVSALLLYRGWRTGVRLDGDGLTICYFFGTRRLGWHEVSRFADGRTAGMFDAWDDALAQLAGNRDPDAKLLAVLALGMLAGFEHGAQRITGAVSNLRKVVIDAKLV